RSRIKNRTFIPTTKRRSTANRKAESRQRQACYAWDGRRSLPSRRRAVQYGAFVISLDFELLWGVRDNRTIADYGANILRVREVVPALLDLFAERNIACTWATVGLLFFSTNAAMRAALPTRKPRYSDARLSSYNYLDEVGSDEESDPYYYGLSLIKRILDHP